MHDPAAKLVSMANQIGHFFVAQRNDRAVIEIAAHLRQFWEPRMRRAIVAHLDKGGAGLHPVVAEAVQQLREPHDGDATKAE
jgi:formate dehydrogenase subunit delta